MKGDIKAFLKTGKGKLILAVCAMLLSWIFLLFHFAPDLSGWIPDPQREENLKKEIRKLEEEQKALQKKLDALASLRRKYRAMTAACWMPERDGDPEILLRQNVETAAKAAEISLNNLGAVRTSRINDELYFAEIDIMVNAAFENVMRFLGKIQESKPKPAWRRIVINQMFRPPMAQNTRVVSNTANAAASAQTNLMLNGTLRVMVYEGKTPSEGGKVRSKRENGK